MTSVLSKDTVPLGSGPPTREELLVYYPHKFTWDQLKTFVNSGDLGLLKRDRTLQKRYDAWAVGIIEKYGSMVNYLLNHRLQWGKPDTQSLLASELDREPLDRQQGLDVNHDAVTTQVPYFCWESPLHLISIIQNDWPYSVPPEIEHTLIWTKAPIYHPELLDKSIKPRVDQDGLWGFTGNDTPPPSPSNLPSCIPALSEWGITLETMVKSRPPTELEAALLAKAGREVERFVKMRWVEDKWETAWFVNPPRLQSVPGLAHIHVFARRKCI